MENATKLTGGCLCGAVTYVINGPVHDPGACHCGQCRRQSGHYWASVGVAKDDLTLTGTPRWYSASPIARRGFCADCGSFLFWQAHDAPDIGVSMGSLDAPTGLRLGRHIFVADKGDYYDITDGLPQEARET